MKIKHSRIITQGLSAIGKGELTIDEMFDGIATAFTWTASEFVNQVDLAKAYNRQTPDVESEIESFAQQHKVDRLTTSDISHILRANGIVD